MKIFHACLGIAVVISATISQAQEVSTQVVYRFDDHRFLELKGEDCVGALWYTDTQRGIHTESVKQFYQIFTQPFIHPSEKYIAIPSMNASEFVVSKDYGMTWQIAVFAPKTLEESLKRWSNQSVHPKRENTISFTVINDRGFLVTKPDDAMYKDQKNWIFMSSSPFDAPSVNAETPIKVGRDGDGNNITMPATFKDWSWGTLYITTDEIWQTQLRGKSNWKDLPNHVPEVKDYKGWDHMRCDVNVGKTNL